MKRIRLFWVICGFLLAGISLLTSCNKEFPRRMSVVTLPVDSLLSIARGHIIDMGEDGISGHGFVYDSNALISANAQRIQLGTSSKTGLYEAMLTNLMPHTRYYINSFVVSGSQTTYGDPVVSFITAMNLPEVKTESLTDITDSTATCHGDVTQDGGAQVTSRGICWSILTQPTLLNDHTIDGSGTGKYTGDLNHLKRDTTYFVRSYASNNAGTAYGNELSIKAGESHTSPTVTTAEVTAITQTAATTGGEVVSEGGSPVTSRGVCWSLNPYPVTSDTKTVDGSGPGQFVSSVTGLTANTTYYLRAYAINAVGTAYGDEKQFKSSQEVTVPSITTAAVTNVTNTSAVSGGTVTSDGGANITARGVCWSTGYDPTIADAHTNDGTGAGSFISQITGLQANTFYRVRAYATNSVGTSYGAQQTFSTLQNPALPTVSTAQAMNVTTTTATTGGNVTSDGGSTVTTRGVCWSTSTNPSTANSHTTDGTGTGVFTSNIAGLSSSTNYYIRAYASNNVGTAYGNQITISTLSSFTCGQALAYEGKYYSTVQIGSQCWFRENLNVGTRINGNQNQTNNSIKEKYCQNDLEANCDIYGGLYQWNEAMQYSTSQGVQGLCPPGWHVPSSNSWGTLANNLGGGSVSGGKLKETGTAHWASPNTGATNSSGFTGLPGGYKSITGGFISLNTYGNLITSTQDNSTFAWVWILCYDTQSYYQYSWEKINGFSLRCLKD